jgi:hypothetical protein
LEPNEKICLLDIRQELSDLDVASGFATFNFELIAKFSDAKTGEISEFKKIISIKMASN